MDWHSSELSDLMHKFESSEKGLSEAQVQEKLREYGSNKLDKKIFVS